MWYISGIFPANWGMDYATYHPLKEPEKSIEDLVESARILNINSSSTDWGFLFHTPRGLVPPKHHPSHLLRSE